VAQSAVRLPGLSGQAPKTAEPSWAGIGTGGELALEPRFAQPPNDATATARANTQIRGSARRHAGATLHRAAEGRVSDPDERRTNTRPLFGHSIRRASPRGVRARRLAKRRAVSIGVVAASFDLSGRLTLSVDDRDEAVERFVRRQMDPFQPVASREHAGDVTLEATLTVEPAFLDVQNPARDGTVTASDGERFYVLSRGLACAVPDPVRERPVRFSYEPGFPVGALYGSLVRPAMQLDLLRREAAAVHSAAVEIDGRAVLLAGWSESGKTESALALMERGARFVSDKWTVLGADGEASAFPINVGVRRWVLQYLPTLRPTLPRPARRQLAAAGIAAAVTRPLRGRANAMAELAARAVALADRAAVSPSQLRAAYGHDDDAARRLRLGATAVLTTVRGGEVACEPVDDAWAAARLARSGAYERRELFAVLQRRGYAFPADAADAMERAIAAETTILERALATGRTFEVRAPFPVDPRRVAEALARRL
jgi:hypothetical protein